MCGYRRKGTLHDFKKNIQNCRHVGKQNQTLLASWYEVNKKSCLECGKYIPIEGYKTSEYKEKKFCDSRCSALYQNRIKSMLKEDCKPKNWCKNCGAVIPMHNQYCSNKCQKLLYSNTYVEQWEKGEVDGCMENGGLSSIIRNYLIGSEDSMCSKCGWCEVNQFTGSIPLEIHHKDGNWLNNKKSNLEVLCPNCHSLTKSYKGANRNKGRTYRKSKIDLEFDFEEDEASI